MSGIEIRPAVDSDAGAINDIYNYYVANSTCTYQEQPETLERRLHWLAHHGAAHPVFVAWDADQIVGWAAISPFHRRSAYRYSVENAVYVHRQHLRRGIGKMLMNRLLSASRIAGHHTIIALIDSRQEASIAMHAALGFAEGGRLREVGMKLGDWLDVIYMQKML